MCPSKVGFKGKDGSVANGDANAHARGKSSINRFVCKVALVRRQPLVLCESISIASRVYPGSCGRPLEIRALICIISSDVEVDLNVNVNVNVFYPGPLTRSGSLPRFFVQAIRVCSRGLVNTTPDYGGSGGGESPIVR